MDTNNLASILNGGSILIAAKVILEEVEDGIVSTDTFMAAQNEGIDVQALIDAAEDYYAVFFETNQKLEEVLDDYEASY